MWPLSMYPSKRVRLLKQFPMNVFSRTIKGALWAALCASLVALPASADDRTAGSMPGFTATAAEHATDDDADESAAEKKAAAPITADYGRADYERIEAYGLLTNISDGGLGIDVWKGSRKLFLLSILRDMPSLSGYRTTQGLMRRALLTRNDVTMMDSESKTEPGNDFLTARIEKLIETGDFGDAMKLYTKNPDQPYHEHLARAGILSMMFDGQRALACLEAKSLDSSYNDVLFWQQLLVICDYFMASMSDEKPSKDITDSESLAASKVLQKIVKKSSFRYTLQRPSDFESLTALEKATLINSNRIDYSALKSANIDAFSPLSTALFLQDKNLPNRLRFNVLVHRVAQGLNDTESLVDFYKSITFKAAPEGAEPLADYKDIKGWKRLPYLYKAAAAARKKEMATITSQALALDNMYNTAAFLPFIPYLEDSNPADIPVESIRTAMRVYALASHKAPKAWSKKWAATKTKSNTDDLITLAYNLVTNTPVTLSKTKKNKDDAAAKAPSLTSSQRQIISMLEEKLDKSQKFHKDGASKAYEKSLDLTFGEGYVMPSIGLMDNLEKAEEDRRLGEIVLLSSIALNEVPPEKMYAGLLRKVMYGLETVGLTKEARELAMEVVLGIGKKKEK